MSKPVSKIPCLMAHLDADGYFSCEGFMSNKPAGQEVDLCCDDCAFRCKYCPACANFTKGEDATDQYMGFCSVNQECKKQVKTCNSFTLRLFDSKEEMERYSGLKTE